MFGLLLSCCWAVLSVALSTCVEPDTAVAIAVGLVHANHSVVKPPAGDLNAASAAADAKRSVTRESSSNANQPQAQRNPACDERGCQLAPRTPPQRRFFGKRR